VERLKALGVKFVTVTINAVDPAIGAKMYDFVIWDGKVLRGKEAAERLLKNQLEGIKMCTDAGILVKANIVMVPTVNADHIPAIAKKVKELGAYIVNIIPLIPVPGTKFEKMPAPTPEQRKILQDLCEGDIRQMRHCRFCRADAIGMLDNDRSAEFAHITCGAREAPEGGPVGIQMEGTARHRVAVATSDGSKVDQHFGQTREFWLFDVQDGKLTMAGKVRTDPFLEESMFGPKHKSKIEGMVGALVGSDIVLTSGFGERAEAEIRARGMHPYRGEGPLEQAVLCAVRDLFEKRAEVFE
jgi:nitrogen fixation protein NifB